MTACVSAVEFKLDGTNWTDVTSDVIKPIRWSGGIMGNGPTDRVALPGEMSFELRNDAGNSAGLLGYYTPGHVNCRSGFGTGLQVRLRITFDGRAKTFFKGRIPKDGIMPMPGLYGQRRVSVSVVDWFDNAARHEMQSPAFVENKRADEMIALILANMDVQPGATDYKTGTDTFSTGFDTVRTTTRALSEMAKVALSELGYIYLTHNLTDDEVLRVEGRYTRNDERPAPTDVPLLPVDSDYLATEGSDYLMTESGDYLMLNQLGPVSFDNVQMGLGASAGRNYYNYIRDTVYPRRNDASAVTLATIQQPVYVGIGEAISITLRYKDPSGVATSCAGKNMITPVATTDWLANTAANGSGTNLTASFAVSATFGTGDCTLTFTNNSASNGYILAGSKVRGTGVYIDDPIDVIVTDTAGIASEGQYQLAIDQKYASVASAQAFAPYLLSQYAVSRIDAESYSMCANYSDENMRGFFWLNCGDRVSLAEDVTATDSDYFIQGMEAEIQPGDIVMFTWYVKDAGFDVQDFFILGDVSDGDELDGDKLLAL